MRPLHLGGEPPFEGLLEWLSSEGYEVQDRPTRVQIWVIGGEPPPGALPPGPWVVLSRDPLDTAQRESWLAVLDEESTLIEPFAPSRLRPALRSLAQPLSTKMLDSTALARLYVQGGRALADRIVENFLQQGPQLLQQARSAQQQGGDGRDMLERLHELAGSVGATSLQAFLRSERPDWEVLVKELEAARRVLEQQRRQDRTV